MKALVLADRQLLTEIEMYIAEMVLKLLGGLFLDGGMIYELVWELTVRLLMPTGIGGYKLKQW